MADLTITVPPQHIDAVRDALLHMYAVVAEALHCAAGDHAVGRAAEESLTGHRVELADLDAALEQIGWSYEPVGQPVELTAHPEVLSDVFRQTTVVATEAFERAVDSAARAGRDASEARAALEVLIGRFTLFDQVH